MLQQGFYMFPSRGNCGGGDVAIAGNVVSWLMFRFAIVAIFPYIFVWGSCFWLCASAFLLLSPASRPPAAHNLTNTTCPHTTCPQATCHHTTCSHTTCSPHNLLTHTLSPHNLSPHNLSPHNLSTHNLLTRTTCSHTTCHQTYSHTTCPHTTCPQTTCQHTTCPHTTCPHTTCSRTTCHQTYSHTTCPHTTCPHTTCHRTTCSHTACHHMATSAFTLRGKRGTWQHRASLCVAGVALMAQDWLRRRAWASFGAVVAAAVCVAGVALGDIDLHFAWQAWHLLTSTVTLRGRRGTYGTGLAPVARLGLVWRRGRRGCLRSRRGTWRRRPSLCLAGVALGDIDRHFAWQAWHLWHRTGSGGALGPRLALWSPRLFAWQAWHLATSTFTLRGRRGSWRHRPLFCVAGLWHWAGSGGALGPRLAPWSPPLFAWQAWHLATSTCILRGSRGTLRGRRGTWWHGHAFCVAGVAHMALGWLWYGKCYSLQMRTGMENVLQRHVCWTCFDVSAEAAIDHDCRAGNSCFASSPTTHCSLHTLVVHACCCCLTGLTCQVPLRSSFANLLHSPSAAADRPLAWQSARTAWRPYTCCQERPLPFMVMPVLATYIHA